MSAEEQKNIRGFVEGLAISAITRPSARDRQKALGPSDLADLCDVCVARKIGALMGVTGGPDRDFSLKAWLGTAVHEKLERDLHDVHEHAELEIEVDIAVVPGIGLVKGHIDAFLPRKKTLVDYKTSDIDKIRRYQKTSGPGAYTQGMTTAERNELRDLKRADRAGRLSEEEIGRMVALMAVSDSHSGGVPPEYMGQTMLYLYGLRASGREADYATLVFIPRDSNYVSDIWVVSCEYRPEVAQAVLNRASHLVKLVREGNIRELSPHPDCFPCVVRPRLKR